MITTVTLNASIDKAYHMEKAIENGKVMRVSACRNSAGGKGLNVARIIKLCGSDVNATGLVGGFNGAYLETLLKEDGINNQFYHIKGETRSCINILDLKYGSTEYLEPGCSVEITESKTFLEEVFPKVVQESDVVTLSGSVPGGINTDYYKLLIQSAKAEGKIVILDTSGELLKNGLTAQPTMVKPNQDEMELLFDTKIESIEDVVFYAKKIFDMNIPYVVVSLGKDGALLVCEEGIYQGRPPVMKVVNTVGCGDSMVGAFAVALEKKMSAVEALKYAVSVATANAMSPNTGEFAPEVQKDIFEKIEIVSIEQK